MEEVSVKKGRLYRNRKPIAIVILIILVPLVSIYAINTIILDNNPEPYADISHSLTIWITPEEEEFTLYVDFYGSEQDAYSETNRYSGVQLSVNPVNDGEYQILLWTIPEDILKVWVKIYFDGAAEEPNIIGDIEMGKTTMFQLLGREISFLMEPWLEDG